MSRMKSRDDKTVKMAKVKKSAWSRVVDGMAKLWPHDPPDYLPPNGGGFAADRRAMSRDWRKVGEDMREAVRKHEQAAAGSR